MTNQVLGIIDAQRGFMPAEEGQRLHLNGFGELAIPQGDQVVGPINKLLGAYSLAGAHIFTTQDWHPHETAHFNAEPNYTSTWPVHCVKGTPGAELHPGIKVPTSSGRFIKGFLPLTRGEDDTSYSGYNGVSVTGHTLGEWLYTRGVTSAILGGLALDYCVGQTAIDLRTRLGLDVTVAIDATRAVAEPSAHAMLEQFEELGIKVATTDDLLASLATAAERL